MKHADEKRSAASAQRSGAKVPDSVQVLRWGSGSRRRPNPHGHPNPDQPKSPGQAACWGLARYTATIYAAPAST